MRRYRVAPDGIALVEVEVMSGRWVRVALVNGQLLASADLPVRRAFMLELIVEVTELADNAAGGD